MPHSRVFLLLFVAALVCAGVGLPRRRTLPPPTSSSGAVKPEPPAMEARALSAPTLHAPGPMRPPSASEMGIYNFDPRLVGTRDAELGERLRSSLPSPRHAWRVGEIARTTQDPATRRAAIEALERMRTVGAQRELAELLLRGNLGPEDPLRREIAADLAPARLSDGFAEELALLLDEPALSTEEKGQVAMNLAFVGYRDHEAFPLRLRAKLSPDAQGLLDSAVILAAPSADDVGELLSGP